MSFAASLLLLAAAAVPHAGKAAPQTPSAAAPSAQPAASVHHGVVATAQATAVILRPAIVRLAAARADGVRQGGDTFVRQTRREGRHVSVDFN
jgi:hypothetical protein